MYGLPYTTQQKNCLRLAIEVARALYFECTDSSGSEIDAIRF